MFPARVTPTLTAALFCALPALAAEVDDLAFFRKINRAELVFTAEIASVQEGPTARSLPPIYNFQIRFKNIETLRGRSPKEAEYRHSYRGDNPPTFKVGGKVFATGQRLPDSGHVLSMVAEADEKMLELAKAATALPIGWERTDGKPVSPWAAAGKPCPAPKADAGAVACAKSGRPAASCGPAITFTVEKIIPAGFKEFRNPYGDGKFRVSVANASDKAVTVPALFTDGKQVLWASSLVILGPDGASPDSVFLLPADAGAGDEIKPVTLQPGERLDAEVNTLRLQGVSWPRGGSRVYFRFCLGELAAADFFYYFSAHHDPLRAAANK